MYELIMSGEVRSVTIGRRSRRVPALCIADYLDRLLEQPVDLSAAA
jgi:hypothetical protein